jgi:two-component system, cell cycle response regulator
MAQLVLVVDDSPLVQRMLSAHLQEEGCRVVCAGSGPEALALARAEPPDLVLLDLILRDADGFEVLRALKDDPRTADSPVIFLSARSDVTNKVRGFELGAVDYVVKPFDHVELRARVRAALRVKRYHDLLSSRSRIDALTGLWNRAYLDRRLADECAGVKRYRRRFALLFLDVDHFKSLNDTYGHPVGDRMLTAIAEALAQSLRGGDSACRWGGEEFAIILAESTREAALTVGLRMRERVSQLELMLGGRSVRRTVSIGVASSDDFESSELSPESIIAAADRALYDAKRGGRDRVCLAATTAVSEAATRKMPRVLPANEAGDRIAVVGG